MRLTKLTSIGWGAFFLKEPKNKVLILEVEYSLRKDWGILNFFNKLQFAPWKCCLTTFLDFSNNLQSPPTTLPMNWTELIPLVIIHWIILVNNAKLPTLMGQLFLVPSHKILYSLGAPFMLSELWAGFSCVWNTPFLLWPSRIRCYHFRNPLRKPSFTVFLVSPYWLVCIASIQLWSLGTGLLPFNRITEEKHIHHKGPVTRQGWIASSNS